MPRTARSRVPKKPKAVDEQLAEHLREAENHLVAAVELFLSPQSPDRRVGYLTRLTGAQEAITGLYREELVLIRGPLKSKRRR